MAVGTLLPFFKFGAVGAGFVFLALSFRLLATEMKASPAGRRLPIRSKAIATIFSFAFVSLLFFLSGVFAEAIAPNPFASYVTMDMGHYGFDTTTGTIKFQMARAAPDASRYLPKDEASNYDVILGIREDSKLGPEDGTYKVAIDHMKFDTIDMREWKPESADEAEMFRSKCVRFSIFGVAKDEARRIGKTFNPRDFKSVKLFDTRSTGEHCG